MKRKLTAWILMICMILGSAGVVYAEEIAPSGDPENHVESETVSAAEEQSVESDGNFVYSEAEIPAIEEAAAEEGAELPAAEEAAAEEDADIPAAEETAAEDEELPAAAKPDAAKETAGEAAVLEEAEPTEEAGEASAFEAAEDSMTVTPEEIIVPEEESEVPAANAEVAYEGIQYNVSWTIYDDGSMYIDKAPNQDYGYMTNPGVQPSKDMFTWDAYRDSIKSVTISDQVVDIASNAFADCKNLESFQFQGGGVSSIGWNAFSGCTGLTEFTLPLSLGTLGNRAFYECRNLKTIHNLFSCRLYSIESYTFYGCSSLESVDLPSTVYSIGEAAFQRCSAMTHFTMPHSVYSIGKSAFSSCSSLTEIIISDNVKKIDSNTFYSCSKLERVVLPDGLTEIAKSAFSSCSALKDCLIPDSVTIIGESAFSGCKGLTEIIIPNGVTELPTYSFSNCGASTIILPESLTTIGSGALGFNDMEEIVIPESVTTIKNSAFNYCYELKKITIPSQVKELQYSTFSYCRVLEEVNLPDGLETIGNNVFAGTAIKEITIPGSVTSISETAFSDCASLTDIYFQGSRDAWNAFGLNLDGVTVHCSNFSVPIRIILSDERLLYDGTPKTNGVTVVTGTDTVLIQDEDYTVSYENNVNAGKASVIITGIGSYSGQAEQTFVIEPIPLEENDLIFVGPEAQTYTGSAIKAAVEVHYNGNKLVEKTDYTLAYADHKEVGIASVTIQGKGNYAFTVRKDFQIKKAAQKPTIKASATKLAVKKTATISVTGMKENPVLEYATSDKTIAAVDENGKITAKKPGKATITVTWKTTTHYTGSKKTLTITVVPAATGSFTATNASSGVKLTWQKVANANGYKIYRDSTLVKTASGAATLTWTDTKAVTNGKKYTYKIVAYATIDGTKTESTLSKSLTTYFLKKPAAPTLKNKGSKKLAISWTKNAKATGYQIRYSKTSSFPSGKTTTKKITSKATVSKTYTMPATGTYYVQIRSYYTVGGKTYYSAWSAKQSKKVTA